MNKSIRNRYINFVKTFYNSSNFASSTRVNYLPLEHFFFFPFYPVISISGDRKSVCYTRCN